MFRGYMNTKTFGAWGEQLAVEFLGRLNYRVQERNFSVRFAEIDIIARLPNQTLSFIEVKTRSHGEMSAERATSMCKRKKIAHAAKMYCLQNAIDLNYTTCIFEHISVYVDVTHKRVRLKKYFLPL